MIALPRTVARMARSYNGAAIRNVIAGLLLAVAGAVAALEPVEFRDAAEEARFRALTEELRCVMCQNQSLADSNAPIAHDLRRQVLNLMRQGRDDAQIKEYLVQRYSEFVLYRPPLEPATWPLWFGPLAVLLIGVGVVAVIVRRQARRAPAAPPAENDQEW